MSNKHILPFLFIVLLANFALAQINAVFEPSEATIRQNETATFLLTIEHGSSETEFFELFSPDIVWDIRPDRPLRVEPNKEFVAKVYVKPLKVAPGTYGIPLDVRIAGTREEVKTNLVLEILPIVDTGETYLPAFKGNASMPAMVDPRNEVKVALDIQNLNRRNLSDVNIKLRSEHINRDYVMSLATLEKKGFEFTITLDPKTEPKKGILRISLIKSELDKTFQYDVPPLKYEIVKFGGVETVVETQKEWFMRTYAVTLTNNGNTEVQDTFAFPSNVVQSILTIAEPEGKAVGGFLTWDLRLAAGQSLRIKITRNYRVLVGILLLAGLGAAFYYAFRSPVVLRKSIRIVREEDNATELKVKIDVRNRSKNELTEVEVSDIIPAIAEPVHQFEIGTLEPTKILKHEHKGTILKWTIDVLEPNEERVLTYRIRTRYTIVGGLSLPAAQARVVTKSGSVKTSTSNTASLEK